MPEYPLSKVVLITGCSSGFGMLSAARLAAKGHRVFATMRDLGKNEMLLAEAKKRGGEKNLTVLELDVTKPATIKAAVNEIVAEEGVVDVLVNNAGYGVGGYFEDLSEKDIRDQFEVNFFGVLNVTREALTVMRPRRKGLIINVSSMCASAGTPTSTAYCASKWALEGFSECLYMELQPFGVDVALVEPGSYRTKIFDENARYAKGFNNSQSPYFRNSQRVKSLVKNLLEKNRKDPEEVAAVIEKIVERPFPSFRNIVGWRSRLRFWLVRHIPFKLYALLVLMFISPEEPERV
jgi:NAD(P)-dependent dehydrogenase (short-subunit alcohol dehydrogenase family)